ncbi:MAG TPA: hypothetical protein VF532_12785, partial [Candidatus Angelobacter sp.]
NPNPADTSHPAYDVFDPATGKTLPGMFAVGWARKASDGLVGIARHDGEVGAAQVLAYLQGVGEGNALSAEQIRRELDKRNLRVIDKSDLEKLGRAEEKIAQERGMTWFKFDNDQDMLAAIDAEKAKAVTV